MGTPARNNICLLMIMKVRAQENLEKGSTAMCPPPYLPLCNGWRYAGLQS